MTHSAADEWSWKIEREVTAALVHLRKLLRVRNRLCSPFLNLPTETIVRILSFVMADLDSYLYTGFWWSIYGTCHRIHDIMCSATELWWRVDWARPRTASFMIMRSTGNPRVIVSDLRSLHDRSLVEELLDRWKDKQGIRGHCLHTLEFFGPPPSFDHFSWILAQSLPRVRRLKIHVDSSAVGGGLVWLYSGPVTLELPMDMPLQVLDLRNATLSWSSQSHLLKGLRELHLNWGDWYPHVVIPEDELFGILSASPQLEHLSLVGVGHEVPERNGEPLPPKRILQFPNLASFTISNYPMAIKYTLAYMGLPVITSLSIRSFIYWDTGAAWDGARVLKNRLFPDDNLLARLIQNPPIFAVRITGPGVPRGSIEIDIGSIKLLFEFPLAQGGDAREAVMTFIPSLVPPSVTTLELEYTKLPERVWRDFFMSHPEVRSIKCVDSSGVPVSRSLWDALSPAGEDAGILCPKLDSVSITPYTGDVTFTSLSDCLRNRQTAGFKLKRLRTVYYHRWMEGMDNFDEEFGPLVEVVEADRPNTLGEQRVSPISGLEAVCAEQPLVGRKSFKAMGAAWNLGSRCCPSFIYRLRANPHRPSSHGGDDNCTLENEAETGRLGFVNHRDRAYLH
jgi:hypothetical protein